MNTDCSKCKTPMPSLPAPKFNGNPMNAASFTVTAYACQVCGHWNDLKRRKGFKTAKPTAA